MTEHSRTTTSRTSRDPISGHSSSDEAEQVARQQLKWLQISPRREQAGETLPERSEREQHAIRHRPGCESAPARPSRRTPQHPAASASADPPTVRRLQYRGGGAWGRRVSFRDSARCRRGRLQQRVRGHALYRRAHDHEAPRGPRPGWQSPAFPVAAFGCHQTVAAPAVTMAPIQHHLDGGHVGEVGAEVPKEVRTVAVYNESVSHGRF
jgi:hypothetical protein